MIAKNYLEEKQIKRLERAISGYFDYIEDLVERENTFTMEEFARSVYVKRNQIMLYKNIF